MFDLKIACQLTDSICYSWKLAIFGRFLGQNFQSALPWKWQCVGLKGTLITWFWVTVNMIGKFK